MHRFTGAAHPTGCDLTDARILSIATVFGLTIGAMVYASASFSGDARCSQLAITQQHGLLLDARSELTNDMRQGTLVMHDVREHNSPYAMENAAGGHLNPAITLGFLVARKITAQRAFCYWGAQVGRAGCFDTLC